MNSVDLRNFSELVRKMVNAEPAKTKELYFQLLDLNKDKKLCERDMFQLLLTIEDPHLLRYMTEDLIQVQKYLSTHREKQGKNDFVKLKLEQVNANVDKAAIKGHALETVDPKQQVRRFLDTVEDYKAKIKEKEEDEMDDEQAAAKAKGEAPVVRPAGGAAGENKDGLSKSIQNDLYIP